MQLILEVWQCDYVWTLPILTASQSDKTGWSTPEFHVRHMWMHDWMDGEKKKEKKSLINLLQNCDKKHVDKPAFEQLFLCVMKNNNNVKVDITCDAFYKTWNVMSSVKSLYLCFSCSSFDWYLGTGYMTYTCAFPIFRNDITSKTYLFLQN